MTGKEALKLRLSRSENQTVFWKRIGTTQSGGCRYEQGRDVPRATQILLDLTYLSEAQAAKLLRQLRK